MHYHRLEIDAEEVEDTALPLEECTEVQGHEQVEEVVTKKGRDVLEEEGGGGSPSGGVDVPATASAREAHNHIGRPAPPAHQPHRTEEVNKQAAAIMLDIQKRKEGGGWRTYCTTFTAYKTWYKMRYQEYPSACQHTCVPFVNRQLATDFISHMAATQKTNGQVPYPVELMRATRHSTLALLFPVFTTDKECPNSVELPPQRPLADCKGRVGSRNRMCC